MNPDASLSAGPPESRRHQMRPKLLVSVRDGDEAEAAIAGGADWIDLKEPSAGALGAVSHGAAATAIARVAKRRPLSAAAGELCQWSPAGSRRFGALGLSLVKLGLAECAGSQWGHPWRSAQRHLRDDGLDLVAVVYADHQRANAPQGGEIIEFAANAGAQWILWDTFDKSAGPLTALLTFHELLLQLSLARDAGLFTVVAGSLRAELIHSLPLGYIDMIAVRTAACEGGRTGKVCSQRVAGLKKMLAAARSE